MSNSGDVYKHVYPVIDLMVGAAVRDIEEDGEKVSCGKGCSHCCHLLVEIFWEEARELASWIVSLPSEQQAQWMPKVINNADAFVSLCSKKKHWDVYSRSFSDEDLEFPDSLCDEYFYKNQRPCSFLGADGACQSYNNRPSSCRLHLVTSDPELCSYEADEDDDDYEIPDRIEELGDEVGVVNSAAALDGRRGQMAVLVLEVLAEEFNINAREKSYAQA